VWHATEPMSIGDLELMMAKRIEENREEKAQAEFEDSEGSEMGLVETETPGHASSLRVHTSMSSALGKTSAKLLKPVVVRFRSTPHGHAQLNIVDSHAHATTFCRVEDYALILQGRWHKDRVWSLQSLHPKNRPSNANNGEEDEGCVPTDAWCHLLLPGERRGRFYYGELTQDGLRHGVGVLYGEEADTDPQFRKDFEAGSMWEKQGHPKDWPIKLHSEEFRACKFDAFIKTFLKNNKYSETMKHITYYGQWQDNMPEGNGIQHFADEPGKQGGTYLGQFHKGQRHGRGVWITNDGVRTYRPIKRKNILVPNWDKDLMHGVGIVEDKQHVHENVIYTHGKCHMPFVDFGPPSTGFGTLGTGVFKRRPREEKSAPLSSIKGGFASKEYKKNHKESNQGVDPKETGALKGVGAGRGIAAARMNKDVKALGNATSLAMQAGDAEVMALVREPTDLDLPEEDVYVDGGTGENEALNGFYFKMSGTFGIPMYRSVKKGNGFSIMGSSYVQRYLLKDANSGNCWIISDKTSGGLQILPGMAFAEDPKAETPAKVISDWYVWHPHSKTMKSAAEEESRAGTEETKYKNKKPREELTKYPVDTLKLRSILGFAVNYEEVPLGPKPGLYLRHGSQLYSRPVYESEYHGTAADGSDQCQFLYWMEDNGSLAKGCKDDDMVKDVGLKRFQNPGCWAIGELGAAKTEDRCKAYCVDIAATPNLISGRWMVRGNKGGFVADPKFQLKMQEWSGAAPVGSVGSASPAKQLPQFHGLAGLDGLEPGPPPTSPTKKGGDSGAGVSTLLGPSSPGGGSSAASPLLG